VAEARIREANEGDVPLILSLIRELAEYEKLSDEVVATEDGLRDSLFGERRYAEVLIAEHDGAPAGFALFFHNFSTFLGKPGIYLEDLYVKRAFRGSGIGKKLLVHLASLAKRRGCGRLEWWVLDWNEPSIGFYKKLGAVPMDDWTVYRVSGSALEDLASGA
jgi:GNAT superfamily N-acetyltransferase